MDRWMAAATEQQQQQKPKQIFAKKRETKTVLIVKSTKSHCMATRCNRNPHYRFGSEHHWTNFACKYEWPNGQMSSDDGHHHQPSGVENEDNDCCLPIMMSFCRQCCRFDEIIDQILYCGIVDSTLPISYLYRT